MSGTGIEKVGLTRQQVEHIKSSNDATNDSIYRIPERNPLLIIHFLKSKISDDIKITDSKKERMAKNKINGFYMSEFPLIAYSLSFPRSKHASTNDSVEYQVNDVYYRSMHDVREDEIGDEY